MSSVVVFSLIVISVLIGVQGDDFNDVVLVGISDLNEIQVNSQNMRRVIILNKLNAV